jgi:hypothetical protein
MKKVEATIHVPGIDPSNFSAVANEINRHLASFSQLQQPLKLEDLPAYLPSKEPPPVIQPWEIYSDLKKVSITKAGGPDNVPPKVLKEFAYELSMRVTDIINASLKRGKVPTQWKEANVVPVPEQTPPSINKLRPISLTAGLAKVAESRVSKWIMNTIEPIIDKRQFGNQKGMSTTHCLIDIYHHIVSGVEKAGNISTLVLTDFTKAFDMIDHKIAIMNLLSMGVSPALVQWVVDFLTRRKQRVNTNEMFLNGYHCQVGSPKAPTWVPLHFSP